MDQGVLKSLKLRYKKMLLRRLLIEDDRGGSIVDFLKSVNMKIVTNRITEAWDEIRSSSKKFFSGVILTNPSGDRAPTYIF